MPTDSLITLEEALLDLNKAGVLKIVGATVEAADPDLAQQTIDAIAAALQVVGKRFQEGEWFLNELVYSGEIAKEAMGMLSPLLRDEGASSEGKIVVGTVFGDLHDLGKDIFVNYATSAGFEVIDLGVDVAIEKFTRAVVEHQPVALGISCLLTPAAGGIHRVIEELVRKGVRDQLKVIIGGAAITEDFAKDVGADAFAPDAVTGTDILRDWSARA